MDGDAPAYFPAAVEWSQGRPLANPLWPAPLNDSIDGPGGRRFVYHGFLYPIVVGGIGRLLGGGARATVGAAYVVHWLAALFGSLAVLSWMRFRGWWKVLAAALLPFSFLGSSIAWHGRVEPLAIVLVGIGALAWKMRAPARDFIAAGVVAGLIATTPAVGMLGVIVLAAALVLDPEARFSALWRAAVGAGAVALAAILIYPYPIRDWVAGVLRHSQINLGLKPWQAFGQTWLTAAESPLLAVTIGCLLVASAVAVVQLSRGLVAWRRVGVAITGLLFAAGLTRLALIKTEASYNAVVWIPLFASLALASIRTVPAALVCAAALALPVVGMARSAALLANQYRAGAVQFADLRDELRSLDRRDYSISPGLWLALDSLDHEAITSSQESERRYFVQQQFKTGRSAPADLPGYRVIVNHFRPAARAFGMPIARTAGGWEFAVYEAYQR